MSPAPRDDAVAADLQELEAFITHGGGVTPLVQAPDTDLNQHMVAAAEPDNESWITESSREVDDVSVSSLGDSLRSWTDADRQFGTPARWTWHSRRIRREAAVAAGDGGASAVADNTLPAADIEGHDQEEDGAPPSPKAAPLTSGKFKAVKPPPELFRKTQTPVGAKSPPPGFLSTCKDPHPQSRTRPHCVRQSAPMWTVCQSRK